MRVRRRATDLRVDEAPERVVELEADVEGCPAAADGHLDRLGHVGRQPGQEGVVHGLMRRLARRPPAHRPPARRLRKPFHGGYRLWKQPISSDFQSLLYATVAYDSRVVPQKETTTLEILE